VTLLLMARNTPAVAAVLRAMLSIAILRDGEVTRNDLSAVRE